MSGMADTLAGGLERVFTQIQEQRMDGVPVLNPRLRVQAVGFHPRDGAFLGVLITPWFMNLVLLPEEGDGWQDLPVGSTVRHHFPAGEYDFIVGHEEGLGRYQSCSLFSPMFEFADMAAAVATAEAALEALLAPAEEAPEAATPTPVEAVVERRLERPVSRRDMLRGLFGGGD
jgi:[NiFe] hydrogenase assembly HybE family chaperone